MNEKANQTATQTAIKLVVPGTGFLCYDATPRKAVSVLSNGDLDLVGSDLGDGFYYTPGSDEWSFRFGDTRASDFDFEHVLEVKLIEGVSRDGADDRWAVSQEAMKSSTWTDLLSANGVLDRKEHLACVASQAVKDYDFGSGLTLIETGETWEHSPDGNELTQYARVEAWSADRNDGSPPSLDSFDLIFTARFSAGSATLMEAFASDNEGKIWRGNAAPKPANPLRSVELCIRAAKAHGEESAPDHEVGDLQDCLREMWKLLTPEQCEAYMSSSSVIERLESGLSTREFESMYPAKV
ncbi:hypothetical protein [Burkholderia sp. Ac-20365]|uniref:hypothetical protein n=1 Tax=Burkholderia sp. Ac-20365 TaxID=2703897 RepID=UPI00197B8EBA|nr:hypothetical protein [Burkholderia sp. Ac-20365]MBN3761017.1 hypothetical protein [Burkholderia sp. Ac-20365]